MSPSSPARPWFSRVARAAVAAVVTLLGLDLVWLGVVAKGLYDEALGPLRRDDVFWPAALAFYALYVGAVLAHAALPSRTAGEALRRGAGLGLVAYGTYELTNWAVLRSWPSVLVPIDLGWGVVLTAVVATAAWKAAGPRALEGAP
jgi:uncharacterized membrane protein